MGVMPRETLMHSSAPFADAAGAMWGGWAATVIALAAVISSLGALNGWTLMLAQVPMAAARDGAMPAVFGQLSPKGVPARGILISVGLSSHARAARDAPGPRRWSPSTKLSSTCRPTPR